MEITMLKPMNTRLQHFLDNAPASMEEVAECMLLALERAAEIATEYFDRPQDVPPALEVELRTLDELVVANMALADKLMAVQLSKFCEQLMDTALEADAVWQHPEFGSLARSAGQTLH
jgi:hypothetical protein